MNDDFSPNAGGPVFHARYEEDEENNLPMPEHVLPSFEDEIVLDGYYRTTGTICDGSGNIVESNATIIQAQNDENCAYWRNLHGGLQADCCYGTVRDGYIVTRSQDGQNMWEFDAEKKVAIKLSRYAKIEEIRNNNGGLMEDPFQEIRATQEVERRFIDGIHQPTIDLLEVNERFERARRIIDNWGIMTTIDVLSISGVGDEEDGVYVIMPHFQGDELFGILHDTDTQKFASLSEDIARQRFTEMLNCVEKLHNIRICHRDLSLENVMLHEERMMIVLIDLGAALKIPYNEEGRRCLIHAKGAGKTYCRAPEGWSRDNRFTVDGVSLDLWAVGVILHVMVTGYRPWGGVGDSRCDMDSAYVEPRSRNYDSLTEVSHLERQGYKFSKDLKDLFQRMFKTWPEDRLSLNGIKQHKWTTGVWTTGGCISCTIN